MNIRSAAMAAIIGAVMASSGGSIRAAEVIVPANQGATVPAGMVQQDDRFINLINKAEDPSTAINAYADAKAAEPNNLAVQQAYVRKMVSFQLPEMAETQAKEIINKDTRDPIAWAVLAYMHAKEDMTTQALTEIGVAEQRAPDDPFVMKTAGQLVAWYDLRADKSQIPEAVKNSVEAMRKDLAGKPIFADTYAHAAEAYRTAMNPATQPTESSSATGTQYVPPPVIPQQTTETYTPTYTTGYPSYPEYPYYYSSYYPYYQPWYPYWYGGSVIIFEDFHDHHHHDHDHVHHHHDGFWHDGAWHNHNDGNFLPLVHQHDGAGTSASGTSVVSVTHPMHQGISVPQTPRYGMERPSVVQSSPSEFMRRSVSGTSGSATITREGGIEIIRGSSTFAQPSRSPTILSSPSLPTRAAVGGGMHSMPSVSAPMHGGGGPVISAPAGGGAHIGPGVIGGGIGPGAYGAPSAGMGGGGGGGHR